MDYDVHIVHSPTDNLLVKAESLEILLRCGIHPLVAVKVVGLWADAEKVFMQSKGYLDAKYQPIEEIIKRNGLEGQIPIAEQILNGNKTV